MSYDVAGNILLYVLIKLQFLNMALQQILVVGGIK